MHVLLIGDLIRRRDGGERRRLGREAAGRFDRVFGGPQELSIFRDRQFLVLRELAVGLFEKVGTLASEMQS